MTEKRSAPRIQVSMAIAFSSTGDFVCGDIMNISCTGVFIMTEAILPANTELALRIRLPDDLETMDMEGRVMWAKEASPASPAGLGIEFVRMALSHRRKITAFVEEQVFEQNRLERSSYVTTISA